MRISGTLIISGGGLLVPDPYKASASTTNPQSWNRYAYVLGDPVNFRDQRGLQEQGPEYDPFEGLISLMLYRLRAPHYESGEPERLEGVHDIHQDSTRHGRDWAVVGLKHMNQNCKSDLNRAVGPGGQSTLGAELLLAAGDMKVIYEWDSATMNTPIHEILGSAPGSQTVAQWIEEQYPDPARRAQLRGFAYGEIVFIATSGAQNNRDLTKHLIHELFHAANIGVGPDGHLAIAKLLGLEPGKNGAPLGSSSDLVTWWADKCLGTFQ